MDAAEDFAYYNAKKSSLLLSIGSEAEIIEKRYYFLDCTPNL